MQKIIAAKQVGDVSYLVSNDSTLRTILVEGRILSSDKQEQNPNTSRPQNYVSLARNLTSAAFRNNSRWRWGVILDGDKLSSRYRIEPYSFSGAGATGNSKNVLRVKYIAKYDTGICVVAPVNWKAQRISEKAYDAIKRAMLSQPEEYNEKKHLVFQDGGKYRTANGRLVEKYIYNVKAGGIFLNERTLGSDCQYVTKLSIFNETEERIWTDKPYINISGCIKGIVVPKNLTPDEELNYQKTLNVAAMQIGEDFDVVSY